MSKVEINKELREKLVNWTDDAIDAATRVICHGFPLVSDEHSKTLVGRIAQGNCWAPDCPCWEEGRELTRAALEAAIEAMKMKNNIMTKAELKKSHDAMAEFLKRLCHYSDSFFRRTQAVEEHYREARRLLKNAGFEYKAPRKPG